jgi:hypothetical protein
VCVGDNPKGTDKSTTRYETGGNFTMTHYFTERSSAVKPIKEKGYNKVKDQNKNAIGKI